MRKLLLIVLLKKEERLGVNYPPHGRPQLRPSIQRVTPGVQVEYASDVGVGRG